MESLQLLDELVWKFNFGELWSMNFYHRDPSCHRVKLSREQRAAESGMEEAIVGY